jgi:hypothetical protein
MVPFQRFYPLPVQLIGQPLPLKLMRSLPFVEDELDETSTLFLLPISIVHCSQLNFLSSY